MIDYQKNGNDTIVRIKVDRRELSNALFRFGFSIGLGLCGAIICASATILTLSKILLWVAK